MPADNHINNGSMNLPTDEYEYKLLTDYELPPPPPVPTNSSHQDKVVDDEYLSGMYTDSLSSGQMINEEPFLEQYTGYQTGGHSPVRPPSDILKCALQELGIVYHKLQAADQHNLCSKNILQAAMS